MPAWSQRVGLMFFRKKYASGKQFNGKDNRTGDGLIPRKIGNAMAVSTMGCCSAVMKISKHSLDKRITKEMWTDGVLFYCFLNDLQQNLFVFTHIYNLPINSKLCLASFKEKLIESITKHCHRRFTSPSENFNVIILHYCAK